MDEIDLINLVRAHPGLYDLNDPQYDVRPRRDAAWRQIGDALRLSPRDCRDKWKRIRDCYRRALKLRRMKSERGAKIIKKIKYEKALSFLDPHLKDDNEPPAEPAPPADCADSSCDESSAPDAHSPRTCSPRDSPQHVAVAPCRRRPRLEPAPPDEPYPALAGHSYAPAPDRDKVTDFFMGLVQTVKDFPEDVQIKVKREIFKVVSDAEELVYNTSQNQLVVLGSVKQE